MGKQQTDATGRVIPTREAIAKEIQPILSALVNEVEWAVQVPGAVNIDREKEYKAIDYAVKEIVDILIQRIDDDHWPTLKQGIAIGRREAGSVFLSAFEAELGDTDDINYRPVLEAAKRAVKALEGGKG